MSQWYVVSNNQPIGPLGQLEIQQRVLGGEFNNDTLVCRVGASERTPLGSDGLLRAAPPRLPGIGAAPARNDSSWDVAATARYHRSTMYFLTGMLGCLLAVILASMAAPQDAGGGGLVFVLAGLYWVCALAALVFLFLTLLAMRVHVVMAVLTALLVLIPCISLITLLVASQVIQSRLKSAGLHVGFFGVSPADLARIGTRPR